MEFTREAWENAPEGARLEVLSLSGEKWIAANLVGYTSQGRPVIERKIDGITHTASFQSLRIILPKRKVTVQLWRTAAGGLWSCTHKVDYPMPVGWTFLDEHTFEIEGE